MSKQYTPEEVAQILHEKLKDMTKAKLESLEKSENKVEEVSLPEGQKEFKTKENKSGLPEATTKEQVAVDTLGKADPSMKTSAQMAGIKIPGQAKPPMATPKPINNAKAGIIKPPKMPGGGSGMSGAAKPPGMGMPKAPKLGAGLQKFMEGRSEKLQKARVDEGKSEEMKRLNRRPGVGHRSGGKQTFDSSQGPKVKGGHIEAAKESAKNTLKNIKAAPKPNLGKAEEKGVHTAIASKIHSGKELGELRSKGYQGNKGGKSWAGLEVSGAKNLRDPNYSSPGVPDHKREGIAKIREESAKASHKKVLGEIKKMPKPDLGKSESLEKGLKEKAAAGLMAAGIAAGAATGVQATKQAADMAHKAKIEHKAPVKAAPAKPAMKKAEPHHPGPKSAVPKYDAARQAEEEAKLKTPEGEKARQEGNKERMKKAEACPKGCVEKHEHIGWGKLHGKLGREGYSKESADKIAGSIKAKVHPGKK